MRTGEQPVARQAFCERYPELQPDLQRELETVDEIDAAFEPGAEPAAAAASAEPLPEKLSGYKILAEIGSGGMGRVLLAFDERLGRKVAIKVLSPRYRANQQLRDRFMQEARAMARLSHPHIARIYSLGPAGEEPHFVMEYLEGASLTQAAEPLTLRQKVELLRKAALAADFLHRHQLLHRDLKPANILVGPDLEPKVLDFGLAVQVEEPGDGGFQPGEIAGTPAYFSPEQAAGAALDARSDVFSLGAIFYEILTGALPFRGDTVSQQLRSICTQDPVLPRRINPGVPGELQNIGLKALEKNPAHRYASAREMADDLGRFLAGEPVLAAPSSYARLMSGKIEQHVRELEGWRHDRIISDGEYDSLRRLYGRLVEREDAWIMEARRLSLPQVSLYLGAWLLAVGAALLLLFHYSKLAGAPSVLAVSAAAGLTAWLGIGWWRRGQSRIGIAYLLAFCLLLPVSLLVVMNEYGLFTALTRNRQELEIFSKFAGFKRTTNAQLWWALLLSLPVYCWLRRFTRASVFSLVFAVTGALLSLVTLLRMGMLEWLDTDPGRVFFRLIPFALAFFVAGLSIERLRHPADSRYFFPIAVLFTLVALSGVATFHEPYARWLERAAPWTRGQLEYPFIINAGIYFALQRLCDRFPSAQMRAVAKAFRFVIPGHVMTSLLLLGLAATSRWQAASSDATLRFEARLFEWLLPAAACLFVFGSVPKQMKNFFATGLVFLAIGLVRLQQNLFRDRGAWPLSLLVLGLALMLAAANYSALRMSVSHWFRRS